MMKENKKTTQNIVSTTLLRLIPEEEPVKHISRPDTKASPKDKTKTRKKGPVTRRDKRQRQDKNTTRQRQDKTKQNKTRKDKDKTKQDKRQDDTFEPGDMEVHEIFPSQHVRHTFNNRVKVRGFQMSKGQHQQIQKCNTPYPSSETGP
jgi:hypothetical protein